MNRSGFTLVELMAVLLILAIFAGVVMLLPAQWFASAKMEDAIDRVMFIDRQSRYRALHSDSPVSLEFDLRKGRVYSRYRDDTQQGGAGAYQVSMPSGFKMGSVYLLNRSHDYGQLRVPVSMRGYTPSYAVRIDGPEDQSRWLVMIGLTGQMMTFEKERQVADVFEQMS